MAATAAVPGRHETRRHTWWSTAPPHRETLRVAVMNSPPLIPLPGSYRASTERAVAGYRTTAPRCARAPGVTHAPGRLPAFTPRSERSAPCHSPAGPPPARAPRTAPSACGRITVSPVTLIFYRYDRYGRLTEKADLIRKGVSVG